MAKYRKKPIIIEAYQVTDDEQTREIPNWVLDALMVRKIILIEETRNTFSVQTKEGKMTGKLNDWIIQGIKGELYPCDNEIFLATYEAV